MAKHGKASSDQQSLNSLQSEDARKLMDTVDRLRKVGLSSIVQLPQIVTVGDQSSGKSSTLEAITGIPFPRKENLCTRFATQIVMRRANTESVSVAIIPDKLRPTVERERLASLRLELHNLDKLESLVDEATEAMGLNADDDGAIRAFSRDVLNIEISGPDHPQLTLVDLPGLIHSETKQQTREDVELITGLVEEYIKEKRTIVLAVVSARNDYANQIVLKKVRDLGAAERTLGIVTKVDVLDPESENERVWFELAQNKDVFLQLGWHLIRNRNPKEMASSLKDRDHKESQFFSAGRYRELGREMVGVAALRSRLSSLLYEHLTRELPNLQRELRDKRSEAATQLEQLGQARGTTEEQRNFLMQLGQLFEDHAKAGISGIYRDAFFSCVDITKPVTHPANINRIRAAVQFANLQFAGQMRQYASKYRITERPQELDELDDADSKETTLIKDYEDAKLEQMHITHKEAVKWAQDILERSRGVELPGNFNPQLIGDLFREQSERWADLAEEHVDKVGELCERFVELLLESISLPDVYDKLWVNIIQPALTSRLETAHAELRRLVCDKNGDPITYNHYYTTTIQKIRSKKQESRIGEMIKRHQSGTTDPRSGQTYQTVDVEALKAKLHDTVVEEDMAKFGAEDALICQMAYYKDESKYFTNAVVKQVIERHLVADLPTKIISALKFGVMSPDDVRVLAAEPASIMQEREHLRKKKEMLEQGMKQFRTALGSF